MASLRDTLASLFAKESPSAIQGTPLGKAYPDVAQQEPGLEAPMFSPDDLVGTGIGKAALAGGAKLAPLLLGHTAWHGSPHAFTKFDLSKLGTGEGAQMYGHGMYFAEHPDVAKSYTPRDFKSEDKLSKLYSQAEAKQDYPAMEVYENLMLNKMPSEVSLEGFKGADLLQAQNALKQGTKVYQSQKGANLYKVDIPDEYMPKLLNYDEPIKNQPETLNKIRSLITDEDILKSFNANVEHNITGANAYHSWVPGKTHAEKSELLRSVDIPGIKYLDQGSRTNQAGTKNFVIFDPSNVKVLERNQKIIDLLKQ
jgi:hypothetical protein